MSRRANVLDALDAEWEAMRESRRLREAVRHWGESDPALRHESVADLVVRVEDRSDPQGADRVLIALARQARHDELAARLLLQLVLPGCKRLVRRYGWHDPDERAAFVVTEAWERICTYPVERRPRAVAANVILDVRQRLLRRLASECWHEPIHEVGDAELPTLPAGPEPTDRVVMTLGAAVRAGDLDGGEAHLIATTRIAGFDVAEIARRSGVSEQTLRRQRLRAERRLRRLAAA